MVQVYNWFGGKSAFFAVVILAIGTTMSLLGRLDANAITFFGIVEGLIVTRAMAQDRANSQGIVLPPPGPSNSAE